MQRFQLNSLKHLLLAALAILVLSGAAWFFMGPMFLLRTVQFTVAAKSAGPKWSLEWQDESGKAINGEWLDVARDDAGAAHVQVSTAIPNYRFSFLALRWWEAPGMVLSNPSPVRLVERVFWFSFEPDLRETPSSPGVVVGHGTFSSATPDGQVVWVMPRWTAAQLVDFASLYVILLVFTGAAYRIYKFGGRRIPYDPEFGALALVIIVNAWLAARSPMLYCPDSLDYAVNAMQFLEKPSLDPFNAWRLPGYSLFLWPFLKGLVHYNAALGCAQGLLAVLTAWIASRITRIFLSSPWAALTILLVGLDPVTHVWTRHAMPEVLCTFLATLITWAAIQRDCWARVGLAWSVLAAIGLGVLGAALCYVRANYQVLVLMIPLVAAAWPFVSNQRPRAVLIAAVMLLTTAGCLAPWLIRNDRLYGKPALVVGTGYTQALSLLEDRSFDKNQSGAFTYDQWLQLRDADPQHTGSNETLEVLKAAKDVPVADRVGDVPHVASFDGRAAAVAKESMSRHPDQRWRTSGHALVHLLGLWNPEVTSENHFWSKPMRRATRDNLNHSNKPSDYSGLSPRLVQNIYDRTLEDTTPWVHSGEASVFDTMYRAAAGIRPFWAGLFLLGVVVALMRRQWSLLLAALIPLTHALVLSIYLMDGIDRYQAPFFPLMSVVVCYAIAALGGALRQDDGASSRTGASE